MVAMGIEGLKRALAEAEAAEGKESARLEEIRRRRAEVQATVNASGERLRAAEWARKKALADYAGGLLDQKTLDLARASVEVYAKSFNEAQELLKACETEIARMEGIGNPLAQRADAVRHARRSLWTGIAADLVATKALGWNEVFKEIYAAYMAAEPLTRANSIPEVIFPCLHHFSKDEQREVREALLERYGVNR